MIFNRFFVPSYRNDDPQVRKGSVAKLSVEKPAEKSILHELAFNDDSAQVVLAALKKLNDFALWQKAAQTSHNEVVARNAARWVEEAVFKNNALPLSESERKAYLLESAPTDLIIKVLMEDDDIAANHGLAKRLLARVDRPSVLQAFFLKRAGKALQLEMLEGMQDADLLQKLQRKVSDPDVKARLSELIDSRLAAQQRPIQLERDTTLVLSKLQALMDKSDYETVCSKMVKLQQEYQLLCADFACLSPEIRQQLEHKHTRITEQLARHSERLKTHWLAKQAEREAQASLQAMQQVAAEVEQALAESYRQPGKIDAVRQTELTAQVQKLAELVSAQTALDKAGLEKWHKQLARLEQEVQALPELQALAQQAIAALDRAQALEPGTEDNAQSWQQVRTEWQSLKGQFPRIPADWAERWSKYSKRWQAHFKQQKAASEEGLKQCRKHISSISGLIDAGRFRAAMSRFGKLSCDYHSLSGDAKARIERRFEQLQQQIERLEGWQSYLAKPRKPALLEQAKGLLNENIDDVHHRVSTIRTLRNQWNSLGSTGEQEDDELNTRFDAILEQAFLPCREYFEQLEQQRKQALGVRQDLINAVSALDPELSADALASELEGLKARWREAGPVSKEEYGSLKQGWEAALQPLAEKVAQWHQQNRQQKQALVEQTLLLVEDEDVGAACQKAQQLQQQWKQIGPSGRRFDNRLWQAFRRANDELFGNAKKLRQQTEKQNQTQVEALKQQLSALAAGVTLDSIDATRSALAEAEAAIAGLPAKAAGQLRREISAVHEQIATVSLQRQQQALHKQHQDLVRALGQWRTAESVPEEQIDSTIWQALDKRWQSRFSQSSKPHFSRLWLTIMLEVTFGMSTPDDSDNVRQDVQLAMMTAKLEQGSFLSVEELIEAWISHGPLSEEEIPLLARLKTCLDNYRQTLAEA
ncbi:DUF349 domain-containing protein [Alteromonas aestuariivivens]|uniref:DUF349 domain-containing protein n=1 Tax=Alteromonas aestuariivivens TaxID=1938339 RepID=A0A3D8M8L3_9ALTE|nr:DUF349 domain-containing protein [Alteromonas aestuariivivens]RDV26139.1 DUF349 domain-containing protein [Alteromonas aestuariivivens]